MSNDMYEMGYKRVRGATRCNGFRGIRLNMRKLSIQKLRVRFTQLFKMLYKWRRSYERAVNSLRKGICGKRRSSSGNNWRKNSKSMLITGQKMKPECRLRSLGRTNSFYSEAIADCLEFIKRNSVSLDDRLDDLDHHHDHHDHESSPIVATSLR